MRLFRWPVFLRCLDLLPIIDVALKPGRGLSFLRSSGKRFKMACFLVGFFMSSSSISGSFLLRLAKLGGGKVVAVSLGRPGLNSAAVEGNEPGTSCDLRPREHVDAQYHSLPKKVRAPETQSLSVYHHLYPAEPGLAVFVAFDVPHDVPHDVLGVDQGD